MHIFRDFRTLQGEVLKFVSLKLSLCLSFQMVGLELPIKNKENIREMKEKKSKIYRAAIRKETAKIGS